MSEEKKLSENDVDHGKTEKGAITALYGREKLQSRLKNSVVRPVL